jgi:hypothetical protein
MMVITYPVLDNGHLMCSCVTAAIGDTNLLNTLNVSTTFLKAMEYETLCFWVTFAILSQEHKHHISNIMHAYIRYGGKPE